MAQGQQTADGQRAAPRKRRWLRRLLWTLGILLVIVISAPLALALGPVRDLVADKIGEAIGREVEMESAFAFWGRGVDLEGITVHSPVGFDGPLATVARVHADVDVLALLGGRLAAAVRVVEPHVTYRRNALDEGNAEGILETLQSREAEPEAETDAGHDLHFVVLGGKVEAVGSDGAPPTAVDDIQITVDLTADGRRQVSLRAVVRGGGKAGADARLSADLDLDRGGAGPIAVEAPALDLRRLAEIVRSTTGIAELGGHVEVFGKGRLLADGNLEGTFRTAARNVRGMRDDVELAFDALRAHVSLEHADRATSARVQASMDGLQVRRGAVGARERYTEPRVTLATALHYDPHDGTASVEQARLDAGRTAVIATTQPVRIETEPDLRLQGKAYARLDLGRLGRLHGLVPALEALAAGNLEAHVDGRAADGLAVSALVNVGDLRLAPSAWAPEGYAEPSVVVALALQRDHAAVTKVSLRRLESNLLRASFPPGQEALEIQADAEGRLGMQGSFDLHVKLPALSRLLGSSIGLEQGERLGGALRVTGSSRGTAARSSLDATLTAHDLRLPRSWLELRRPTSLRAVLAVETTPDDVNVEVRELGGVGLAGRGKGRLTRADGELALADGEGSLRADLARARPWLDGLLGLAPAARLAGEATAQVRFVDLGGGRRLVGRAQLNQLDWRSDAAAQPVRQGRVQLDADAQLVSDGGRHQFDVLKLTAEGLSLDFSGATAVTEPQTDLDGTLRVGGDAARLAPVLSALLGPGYEDLRGTGQLRGALRVQGSPARNFRTLRLDGSLDLGAWSTGGVRTTAVRVESTRPGSSSPLALTLRTSLNGGPTQVGATLTLGAQTVPWTANLSVKGADTAGILVSQGPGRYMSFVLPALLPAKATQPVLSGRLIADVSGSASSLSAPAMQDGLRGYGTISMRQGEIRQSTLFGHGGSGLSKVVAVITATVHEAGLVLQEVSKAITFTSLDSQFKIENRVVDVQRVNLIGRRLNIDMHGRVDFEHRLGLQATATVQGSAGQALARHLPGAAIPLGISGTLEQPRAVPAVDLKKLLAGAAGRIPDLVDRIKKKKLPKIPDIFK